MRDPIPDGGAARPARRALVVLGMHRSGTSALAGMLAAAGVASPGPAVRNWDNARGHFEALALIRLNERVLARSGGHWLAAPGEVRWTDEDAAERERLLRARAGGTVALLKDPRTLLTLPFWRAASTGFHALGIVRHPLAVARSLESWRGLPLAKGLELWCAHNRALLADQEHHGYDLLDFDGSRAAFVAAVARACERMGLRAEPERLTMAFDEALVHHDVSERPRLAGLEQALSLHAALLERAGSVGRPLERPAFPRRPMETLESCLARGDRKGALKAARTALAKVADPAAVLVPAVASLVRAQAYEEALALLAIPVVGLASDLLDLLLGKVKLAAGKPAEALEHLERASRTPEPYYQVVRLLPHALRAAGRMSEARAAMLELARHALYPHDPLAQLAEWSWSDAEPEAALVEMARAIESAPRHRRGRMRTRRAEWLLERGARAEAEQELERALEEDPSYPRARTALARLRAPDPAPGEG